MKIYLVLCALLVLVPQITFAAVIISEVAWMGTNNDANDEWIEIYNFSSTPTNINGWTLTDGNSLNIPLTGTMTPHGVFLLERTDDTSVPDVTASIIYKGALVNSGATLTIMDEDGTTVSELVGGDNWENIGGNNEKKYTAQLTMEGVWVTGPPTPGAQNIEESAKIVVEETSPVVNETFEKRGGGEIVSLYQIVS